ncbi:YiiX/YebB-like N1pC/P60 family cysteine hydrolase [Edwardsiella tarda]|uniref:YiiX/YebB-like N1pC/P60 family cysteine hydrolase n=1 Tax=Edwardsiella tarda TaxID=636 RepID=UPI00351C73E0
MYLFDRNKLEPGDIILTRSKEKNSSLICNITKSDFSHAILYVGGSSYIHSDLNGVHSGNIQRLLVDKTQYAKVFRINNPEAIGQAIIYARSQIGTPYSKASAANAFIKVAPSIDERKQYCSRLVAKAFESAGITLVSNSDACLPQEIADSMLVHEVKDCLYQAREEEIEFAKSYNPIAEQSKITNHIFAAAKKLFHDDIYSFDDIIIALIKNPLHDSKLTEIVEDSGYLALWQHELKTNPWRYDVNLFRDKFGANAYTIAVKELNIVHELLARFNLNLEIYNNIQSKHNFKYIRQQISLYEQLIENTKKHKMTAEEILREQ